MKTIHTPGPWYTTPVGGNRGQHLVCAERNGLTIAVTYNDDADAVLIAAAPDMLAALSDFTTWHAEHFEDFSAEINAQLLCLANSAAYAIAKATGQS